MDLKKTHPIPRRRWGGPTARSRSFVKACLGFVKAQLDMIKAPLDVPSVEPDDVFYSSTSNEPTVAFHSTAQYGCTTTQAPARKPVRTDGRTPPRQRRLPGPACEKHVSLRQRQHHAACENGLPGGSKDGPTEAGRTPAPQGTRSTQAPGEGSAAQTSPGRIPERMQQLAAACENGEISSRAVQPACENSSARLLGRLGEGQWCPDGPTTDPKLNPRQALFLRGGGPSTAGTPPNPKSLARGPEQLARTE